MAGKERVPSWKERIDAMVEKHGSREAVATKLGVSYWSLVYWLTRGGTPSVMARERIEDLEKKK